MAELSLKAVSLSENFQTFFSPIATIEDMHGEK